MERKGKIFNIQKFCVSDGPGIRTAVFFSGCPLRCGWCSNPESQNRNAKAARAAFPEREYTAQEVMAAVRQDRAFYEESGGGMTLTGGEVLQQADFAAELIRAARGEGIHSAVETAGYASPEVFDAFLPYPDLLLFDFKHWDSAAHEAGTGVPSGPILRNLRRAVEAGKSVTARIPVIPGFNASLRDAREMARALAGIGVKDVDLLPFHRLGEKKYEDMGIPWAWKGVPPLYPEQLEGYRLEFLDEGLACKIR